MAARAQEDFMRRALVSVAILAATLPVTGIAGGPCAAAATTGLNRAGLVVQLPGGVREFCVSFTEQTISGFELLERSGLAVAYKEFQGQGIAVCRIEGIGCTHDDCFCRCRAGTCEIWGYHHLDASGRWAAATVGADRRVVGDGDVDGWRWGPSTANGGSQPPRDADLDGICLRGTSVAAGAPADRERGSIGVTGIAVFTLAVAALFLVAALRRRSRAGEAAR